MTTPKTTSKPATLPAPSAPETKTPETEAAEKHPLPPKSKEQPKRHSIFDTDYAPEGAERRKQWTRFDPKRK